MENLPEQTGNLSPDYNREIANDTSGKLLSEKGRLRIAIESVKPQVDCGRFPIKRLTGDIVHVEA